MSNDLRLKFELENETSAGLRGVSRDIDRVDGQGRQLSTTWSKVGQDVRSAAKALVGTKLLWDKAFGPGVAAASDLQTIMDRLEATLTDQVKPLAQVRAEMDAIAATADKVGNPLPLDKTQVIAAGVALAKMGQAVQDMQGAKGSLAASSFLAVLEDIDPLTAAGYIGDIGTQFQVAGDQYFDLADSINRAASSSSTSAEDLAQALTFVGGTARRLGIDYKSVLAILATEAKVGLKGSRGGTALEAFLGRLTGAATADQKKIQDALGLSFFDKGGQFVGIQAAIERIRASLARLDQRKREAVLDKLFGTEGGRAANALLQAEGGYEAILATMETQLDLAKKVQIQLKGHKGQADAISGTWKSTLATAFQPLLRVVTALEARGAGFASQLNEAVGESEALQNGISGGAVATLLGGGAFGLFKLLKAGGGALSLLRGVPGAGLAAGIAGGKAVEQLGVQPVFVTNWPGGGIGGGIGGALGGAAAGAGGAGLLARLGAGLGLAGLGAKLTGAAAAAQGALVTAAPALLAGGGGVIAGTILNSQLEKHGLNDSLRESVARGLASMGSSFGQAVLADIAAEREGRVAGPMNFTINIDGEGNATVLAPSGIDSPTVQARRRGTR